jgi:hypothetical protein
MDIEFKLPQSEETIAKFEAMLGDESVAQLGLVTHVANMNNN